MEAGLPALKEREYHISNQNTSTRMEYFANFPAELQWSDGLRGGFTYNLLYMENSKKAQI